MEQSPWNMETVDDSHSKAFPQWNIVTAKYNGTESPWNMVTVEHSQGKTNLQWNFVAMG